MTNGREKSDPAIVAAKQANKAGQPAAEPGERRAGTKGNADRERTLRTQGRDGASQGLDRVRQAARPRLAVRHPRWEPYAGRPHVRLCVQRRLACSAGERPAGVRIRSPVVWIAGWRETKTLKGSSLFQVGELARTSPAMR